MYATHFFQKFKSQKIYMTIYYQIEIDFEQKSSSNSHIYTKHIAVLERCQFAKWRRKRNGAHSPEPRVHKIIN